MWDSNCICLGLLSDSNKLLLVSIISVGDCDFAVVVVDWPAVAASSRTALSLSLSNPIAVSFSIHDIALLNDDDDKSSCDAATVFDWPALAVSASARRLEKMVACKFSIVNSSMDGYKSLTAQPVLLLLLVLLLLRSLPSVLCMVGNREVVLAVKLEVEVPGGR